MGDRRPIGDGWHTVFISVAGRLGLAGRATWAWRVAPGWSVCCLTRPDRVGDLRNFGPAFDIEIGSGDRVASDPDRSPFLIALDPRGGQLSTASGLLRTLSPWQTRAQEPACLWAAHLHSRTVDKPLANFPHGKLRRRVRFSGAGGALGVLGSACPHSDMRLPPRRRNADVRFRLPTWRT